MNLLAAKKARFFSLLEGFFYSLMVGIGETYLVAYALHLGVSERKAAIIGILPLVLGSVLQFPVLRIFRLLKNYRKMMVSFSAMQGIFLLSTCLAQLEILHRYQFEFLFFCSTGYWTLALAAGPTWNAWLGQLINQNEQKSFFLLRNACLHAATLFSLITAGAVLHFSKENQDPYLFAKLFVVAGIFRFLSSFFLSRHPDIASIPSSPRNFQNVKTWLKKRHVRYSFTYTLVLYVGVHISSSFFTPYMLQELKLNYFHFTFLLATALAARSLSGYLMGALTKKHGVQAMFFLGYLLIVPLPFLWTLSNDFQYLVFLQVLSGLAWGAHEMGLTLYLLESIEHDERSKLLSWNHLLASMGMLFGISFGTYLAAEADVGMKNYQMIFEISTYARCVAFLFIGGFISSINPGNVPMRFLSIRPGGGGVLKPVLSKIRKNIPIKNPLLKRNHVNNDRFKH